MTVLADIRARARELPEQPALVIGATGERISYKALLDKSEAHTRALRERGVRVGDRCGLLAQQGKGFVTMALGILGADACCVPISEDYAGSTLDAFAARAHLHHLVSETGGDFSFQSFENVPAADGNDDRDFRSLKPAYLRFTSGTTSERKGVILSHASIEARLTAANRALGITPKDRILWLLPMAHHFVVSILLYLRNGAIILLPKSNLAKDILELAAREDATLFYASPYHYNLLAKDASSIQLKNVRLAISTAEGLRSDIAQRFLARFQFPVAQALGIIEVGLPAINQKHAAAKPGALGRPLSDYEIWLRDEAGKPLVGPTSPERTGEICIRGPGLFDAYLSPWTSARSVLDPNGFCTGDQGWFDADGDLWLAGRRTNRINMAGMKFFCEEVESVLDAHPGVKQSRVFAREHAHLGEIPAAEFVPEDAEKIPSTQELAALCREHLPAYKVPRQFTAVAELPTTATGKLRRTTQADSAPN